MVLQVVKSWLVFCGIQVDLFLFPINVPDVWNDILELEGNAKQTCNVVQKLCASDKFTSNDLCKILVSLFSLLLASLVVIVVWPPVIDKN